MFINPCICIYYLFAIPLQSQKDAKKMQEEIARRPKGNYKAYVNQASSITIFQTAKQSVFSSKSVKKLVKCDGRVLLARSARAHRNTDRIFSVSPQSRSLFSASFQTFCLTARAYLNTQKYGPFCSLTIFRRWRKNYGDGYKILSGGKLK